MLMIKRAHLDGEIRAKPEWLG